MAVATEAKRRIEFQAEERQAKEWEKAASSRGLGLSAWIRDTLNAKAREQQTANQK